MLASRIPYSAVKLSGQFPMEGCKIHHVDQAYVCLLLLPLVLKGLFSPSFQGHGSHGHLLGSTPEQNPDQRPGNAVPNATDARQNGSRLRDSNKEKGKGSKATSFLMKKINK